MNRTEIENQIAAAEARRHEAELRMRQTEERLHRLAEERAELEGDHAIARRGLADFDERLTELTEELAAAEVNEARLELAERAHARDAALATAANAATALNTALREVEEARGLVESMHERLRHLDPSIGKTPPVEPGVLEGPWQELAPLIERELNVRLELQLVAAAVASNNYLEIEKLPEHLQVLARQRKQDAHRKNLEEKRLA